MPDWDNWSNWGNWEMRPLGPIGDIEFREPLFLGLVFLAPLAFWLASRLSATIIYSSLRLPDRAPRSLRIRLAVMPAWLLAIGVACLSIALAGPRTGDATSIVKREGIAIMLVVDRSGSMNARDFVRDDVSVSRLDAVKSVLAQFVTGGEVGGGRPNDLIGVVAFGTYADAVCPLTVDHRNLVTILNELAVPKERSEGRTAIGDGLALAVERLRTYPAKSKVAIVLTDGVNNAGNLSALQAAELASSHGIKVYTVGAGSSGVAPMPMRDPTGRTFLVKQRVEIDEETLKRMAERAGGRYFNARDADGLAETYRAIDALERSELTEIRYLQYREHYPAFVGAALVLILVSTLAGSTVLRRLP